MITASLKNFRISPRKVRLVANMIRGKGVADAQNILNTVIKKAGSPLGDLLNSAVANASHNYQIEKSALFVKEIRVDQGYVMKRSMPVSRGSAHPIMKRTSHVSITLAPIIAKGAKSTKSEKAVEEKPVIEKAKVAKKKTTKK
ncbi:MAG: 50S ribosomal protein L22 [Candidatus Paceibacterota bacterium]|jgi:large subunit ribosomal protein L22